MVRNISDWRIIEDAETLSDHRYIRIAIQADRQSGVSHCSPRSPCHELIKRRNQTSGTTRRLDRYLVVAATRTVAWIPSHLKLL